MKKLYTFAFLLVSAIAVSQNPAALDMTFNIEDQKPILDAPIRRIVAQPDGKYLVLGDFTNIRHHGIRNTFSKNIVRLNADLTYDPTFDIGTGFSAYIFDIAIQSTGKIIVCTMHNTTYNGTAFTGGLVRLNPDGSRDLTMSGGNNYSSPTKLVVQPDDKILAYTGNFVYRHTANGLWDNSFAQIILSGEYIRDVKVLPSGEIITLTSRLRKFQASGAPVNSTLFQNQPDFSCNVKSMALQADGKILVVGAFYNFAEVEGQNHIVRFNTNGSHDTSFTAMPMTSNLLDLYNCMGTTINVAAVQPDGKILVGGIFPDYGGHVTKNLARLNSNGTVDNTFTGGASAEVLALTRLTTGSYMVGTTPTFVEGIQQQALYKDLFVDQVFKIDASGNLLNTNLNSQFQSEQIIAMPNNKIALIGNSGKPYHRGIKLLNADGGLSVNPNLNAGFSSQVGIGYYDSALAAALQPDGKLIVGGYFTSYNGVSKKHLVRLNPDFSIDATFNTGTGILTSDIGTSVSAITVQPDGKILVGGNFNSYNGTPVPGGLMRLTATGAIDPSFVGSALMTNKIVLLPDGKMLVHQTYEPLKRLNANGSNDDTFSYPQSVGTFEVLANGKILITTGSTVGRLHPDGSIDNTFTQISLGSSIRCLLVQPDGKILVGGSFNGRLARLTADGALDPSFDIGTGFNQEVKALNMQSDGKILVAGRFARYDGAWTNGVVRLLGGDAYLVQGNIKYDNANDGCTATDPAYANLKIRVTWGTGSKDFITNTSGSYSIPFPAGTYTLTPVFENSAYQNISPVNRVVNFPQDGIVITQDFCVSALGVHPDLEVIVIPETVARPGFNSTYRVVYKNKGNQVLSGSVTLQFDDAVMDHVSATPTATMTPGLATWNFTNLFPNQSATTKIVFNLNSPTETPAVNGDDILAFVANITPSASDETPLDNTFTFNQTVVNSYDPNDKTCLEGSTVGAVVIGNYVHYMIRFENVGTYAAQNITVTDIIDTSKFDINTLVPLHGSHSFVTNIVGNKVDFYFENINLGFTDSTNDGYVTFKIKTKPSLTVGSTFSNAASIFFDYNPAIVTNTATTVISALATSDFDFANYFTLYPNPVNQTLNVTPNQELAVRSLDIFNMLGQLVMAVSDREGVSAVDVSRLETGHYIIRISTDRGTATSRFIKM